MYLLMYVYVVYVCLSIGARASLCHLLLPHPILLDIYTCIFLSGDGTAQSNPALSCRIIQEKFVQTVPDQGIYWINPNNTGTVFQTVCDMVTAGEEMYIYVYI